MAQHPSGLILIGPLTEKTTELKVSTTPRSPGASGPARST
jgi:hypothetical protein